MDEHTATQNELKSVRKQLESIQHHQSQSHDDELMNLRQFKADYEQSYQTLTSDFYTLQSQNAVLVEKLRNFERENVMLKSRTSLMVGLYDINGF